MKITKRERKIILEHLKQKRKLAKKLPEEYKFIDGITRIRYSTFKRVITPEMIQQVKEEEYL